MQKHLDAMGQPLRATDLVRLIDGELVIVEGFTQEWGDDRFVFNGRTQPCNCAVIATPESIGRENEHCPTGATNIRSKQI